MTAHRFLITHKVVLLIGAIVFLGSAILVLYHSQATFASPTDGGIGRQNVVLDSSSGGNNVALKPLALSASDLSGIDARDAQRISDLQQIRTALEYYFYECGYYPGTAHAKPPCGPYVANNTWTGLSAALINSPLRVTSVPNDPTAGASYVYSAAPGGVGYVIGATLEDLANPVLVQSVHGLINKVNCDSPMYCIQL
jgi:hypothetical protein